MKIKNYVCQSRFKMFALRRGTCLRIKNEDPADIQIGKSVTVKCYIGFDFQ